MGSAAGFGFTNPGFGTGFGAPQAAFFGGNSAAGILETLQVIKQIREVFEQFKPDTAKPDTATKAELERLRTELESLKTEVRALNVPANIGSQLAEIKRSVDDLRSDLQKVRVHLQKTDPKVP
jgi:hypothetical protein